MSILVLKNFRIVDETRDARGSVLVEDGIIKQLCLETDDNYNSASKNMEDIEKHAEAVIDGSISKQKGFSEQGNLVLMPAFVDLHAHFREGGVPQSTAEYQTEKNNILSENLKSACLAAAAGGFGTVVCMANAKPVTDTIAKARSIKKQCDALGLVDVYPVLSLTKGMEGMELSEITLLKEPEFDSEVRLLSEDGKDLANDGIFLAAMKEAARTGIPVSCHCDLDGENNATERVLLLQKKAQCRLHIAHVSTKEAAAMIERAKNSELTCEVTPHHIALTAEDAALLGAESHGRVNPPLRTEDDRKALIAAILNGTIDAIATDHAPHTEKDKEKGSPGFTGLETAFAVCYSTLVIPGFIGLSKLSSLMSASPARILGLDKGSGNRGLISAGLRADLTAADIGTAWAVNPAEFFSHGKNSPYTGKKLTGRIVLTIRGGVPVYDRLNIMQDNKKKY